MENNACHTINVRRWSPCGELHSSAKKVAATKVTSSREKS